MELDEQGARRGVREDDGRDDRAAPSGPASRASSTGAGEIGGEELRRLLDTAVNPFVVIDTAGTVLWAGESISELLGIDARALLGRSMLEFLAPQSVDEALRALAAADDYVRARSDTPDQWEGAGPLLDLVRTDGTEVTCAVAVATPVRTGLPGYAVQLRRAAAAGALERTIASMASGAPIQEVLDHLSAMLAGDLPQTEVAIAWDPVGGPGEAGFAQVAGHVPAALRDVLRTAHGSTTPWAVASQRVGEVVELSAGELPPPVREAARAHGVTLCAAFAVTGAAGEETAAAIVAWRRHGLPLHIFSTEQIVRAGRLVGLALQWERGRRALEWAASHDSLTGLCNRQAFLTTLEGEAAQLPRPASAVLYLDLDDFKPVNDTHGHALGDRLLAEVASRLRRSVRPTDLVARLGGDEFAVLCPGLDDHELLDQLASRLVEEVGAPFHIDGLEIRVGLSVGIAGVVDGAGGPDEVLSRADAALRAAKAEGKRRWRHA